MITTTKSKLSSSASSLLKLGACALIALSFSAPMSFAQETEVKDPKEVLAKIGRTKITRGEVSVAEKNFGPQFNNVPEAQRENAILNTLIDLSLLADKAKDERLHKDKEFKQMLELIELRALHDAYVQEVIGKSIEEAAVREIYERETAPMRGQKQIRARHILLETKEEAEAVIAAIADGGDFVELAKEKSVGPSAPNGGDLGFFGKGNMVPAFEEAVFAMEVGASSAEPVETQFGFHVIKVEENRETPVPVFEQVEPQLRQQMIQAKYLEVIKNEREEQKVELMSEKAEEAK